MCVPILIIKLGIACKTWRSFLIQKVFYQFPVSLYFKYLFIDRMLLISEILHQICEFLVYYVTSPLAYIEQDFVILNYNFLKTFIQQF